MVPIRADLRGVVHDMRDVGMTAVEVARTCGPCSVGRRRWAIRVASAAGLRRDERGLEGQRGRSRGKEGGGQGVEHVHSEAEATVTTRAYCTLTVHSSRYGRPATCLFYYSSNNFVDDSEGI